MGYGVYEDRHARYHGVERWAGYGVPGECDMPDCRTEINRGMGYRCESYWKIEEDEDGDDTESEVGGCQLHFCGEHLPHTEHGDDITPKPDTEEWVRHMMTDESWQEWRESNPEKLTLWAEGNLDASTLTDPPTLRWEYSPGHLDHRVEGGAFVRSSVIAPTYVQQYISEGGEVLRRLVGPWEEVQ